MTHSSTPANASDAPVDGGYTETTARSVLSASVLVDPWFIGSFGLNLYRGCAHGCIYCDGRAERYYVEGDFERDVVVKRNGAELVAAALRRAREPGFLFLGGGVSDSYQPADAKYELARSVLTQVLDCGLSAHVLTKSALVERDFDLLAELARKRRALFSVSLQCVDESIVSKVEPRAASATERLRLVAKARALGMNAGIMAMPLLPGISDSNARIEELVKAAKDAGAEFLCFGGLTLRPGRQKEFYYERLRRWWPELVPGYDRAYASNRASGAPDARWTRKLTQRFAEALAKYGLPSRIPRAVFRGAVPVYTEASVLLEHIEAAALLEGRRVPLMAAGFALAQWARKRLNFVSRRKGGSYRDVEAEFFSRLSDGSLLEIEGMTAPALDRLRELALDTRQPMQLRLPSSRLER
ncbi:MAG: radical SAM protein [Polyangiaceae bacterium]